MNKNTEQLKNERVTLTLTKYELVSIALILQSETCRKDNQDFLGYSEDDVLKIEEKCKEIMKNIDYSDLENKDKNVEEAKKMFDRIYAFTLESVKS